MQPADIAPSSSAPLQGSCLCGKVQYEADSLVSPHMAHCHCLDCRKFHGSAFSTFGETNSLRWIQGQDCLTEYVASNGSLRRFCKCCGSSLTFRASNAPSDTEEIALGTLDVANVPLHPDVHVFVDRQVSWIKLDSPDQLPKYTRGRSSALNTS